MANFWISPRVSIGCLKHVWWRCLLYCACHTKRIFSDPVQTCHTCARTWCGFDISTSKCAAPQCVRCLNSSTAKSAPDLHCFVHFDFEMCFALKSSALFQQLNFQKCSDNEVILTFWLRHARRARAVCSFATSSGHEVFSTFWLRNVLRATAAGSHTLIFFLLALSLFPPLLLHLSICRKFDF